MPQNTTRSLVHTIAALIIGAALIAGGFLPYALTTGAPTPTQASLEYALALQATPDHEAQLAPTRDCSKVEWGAKDADGTPVVPVDINHDGYIDCGSDLELGA